MRFLGLRAKMLLTVSGVLLISMTAFTYIFAHEYRKQVIDHHRKSQYSMLQIVHNALAMSMIRNQREEIRVMMEALHLEKEIKSLRIINLKGIIQHSTTLDETGTAFNDGVLTALRNSDIDSAFFEEIKSGEHDLTTVIKIRNTPRCHRCHGDQDPYLGFLAIETDLRDIDQTISENRWETIYIAMASLLLIGGAIAVIHLRFVKQGFRKVLDAIKKVESGNFQTHVDIRSKDEMGQLSDSFNSMIDRLNLMREELRQAHRSQLERAEKLASVGEIAAGIAHEIKNPIAGISSSINVMLDEMDPDDERLPVFQEIVRQAHRVDDAINNLLSFARPREPLFADVKMSDILASAMRLIREHAKRARIDVDITSDEKLPDIRADREQLEQVLVNLLMNGIQAMPEGGHLRVAVTLNAGQSELKVRISDTGAGIDPGNMEKIFQPFFTTKHRGTGLGLAIVKGIVQRHGGTLLVESAPGKGTTVSVALPADPTVG